MTTWELRSDRVAQACGMVSVQAECTVEEAFTLLTQRAQSTDTTVEDVARRVTERRMRFAPRTD